MDKCGATDLTHLLIIPNEVPQLLLLVLERGVQLLHLVQQVKLLGLQALPVRFQGCDEDIKKYSEPCKY